MMSARWFTTGLVVFLSWAVCCARGADRSLPEALSLQKKYLAAGNYDSALILANEVLELAHAQKDTTTIVVAMSAKGKCLYKLGKQKEGMEMFFSALRICNPTKQWRQAALLYREIGTAYWSQGLGEQCKEYYFKEIDLRTKFQGRDSIIDPLINLAALWQTLKHNDSSEQVFNQIADILTRNYNDASAAYYYFNRGALMQEIKKLDSTLHYYLLARELWSKLKNDKELYKVTFNLGFLEQTRNNSHKAIAYYREAENAAKKFSSAKDLAHVYGTMAESFAAISDFKNAYNYLYLYATMNDSLHQSDFNAYSVRLDKQYQTEKNRAIIEAQKVELNHAGLKAEQQKTTILVITLLLVVVGAATLLLIIKARFTKRVQAGIEAAKARIFADIVHEVRTPLSMIQAPVQLLLANTQDVATRSQLEIADRNVYRLNQLITQMLDLSKTDAVAYTLRESAGSFQLVLRDLATQYALKATTAQLTFTADIADDIPELLFDKDAIEKVLGNLVDNAIKYTPKGGRIGLDCSIAATEADFVQLAITVWDAGVGIAPVEQTRIFDRFYRSDEQRAKVGGLGIGLSLVKELVTLMGGTIALVSDKGAGTTFTVSIPFKIAGSSAALDANSTTVLLAEDDKETLNFNAVLLRQNGYQVLTATNGKEAVELLGQNTVDLVVTDLMMPDMDGLELVKYIRDNAAMAHIPIIMLSARAATEVRVQAANAGVQAYLQKPFNAAELLATVSSQLQLIATQKAVFESKTKDAATNEPIQELIPDEFVQKCTQTINENIANPQLSVELLAELMFINRSHFQRKLKSLTGYSPSEYIRKIRLEKARTLLQHKHGNITEIAYETGFASQSYFTKCYTDYFGYAPSKEMR